jgi:hypothetical protein
MDDEQISKMTALEGGTFLKNLFSLKFTVTFPKTLKIFDKFHTYHVHCLSRFALVRAESQGFVGESRAVVRFISCCREKYQLSLF